MNATSLRVLAFPRYAPVGASSRVRMYQFADFLRGEGIDVTWRPLLPANYLERLYASGQRSLVQMIRCYAARLRAMVQARRYDLVWLEKELMPWAPALLDPGRLGVRYIVDYDDAVFHTYDQHPHAMLRRLYGGKIDAVMRGAAAVIAGNAYIAARARAAGAERVVSIPSVVDEQRFVPRQKPRRDGVTFGWIGNPGSQYLLEPLLPLLADALPPQDRFVSIGAQFARAQFAQHDVRPWSIDSEADAVADFDVGLMPVADAPFERGKCGYKIIQYMACGVPVIASPVGANREIVVDGETGILARDDAAWRTAIARLSADADLRERMGRAARAAFEARYSLSAAAPRLADLMRDCARAA